MKPAITTIAVSTVNYLGHDLIKTSHHMEPIIKDYRGPNNMLVEYSKQGAAKKMYRATVINCYIYINIHKILRTY